MIGMTVCSGIGAPEHAAPWIDWQYQSEIEKFPSAVLAERFPHARNLGDMTKYKDWPDATLDVLCGGTPCQSFSVAGLRAGLDDPRGQLMLTYLAIAARYRPRWVVWENVPGALSSDNGRALAAFLKGLELLGYHAAWRVLDVQHGRTLRFPWAIPQRRNRLFVVGYLGDWRRAAAVLLEPQSLSRNPPPRRKAGQVGAACLSASTGGSSGKDAAEQRLIPVANSGDVSYCLAASAQQSLDAETETETETETLIAFDCKGTQVQTDVSGSAPTLRSMGHAGSHQNGGGQLAVAHALKGEGFDASEDGTGRGTPIVPVAFAQNTRDEVRLLGGDGGISGALAADPGMKQTTYLAEAWAVRRLTPTECERLMGFPDGWTQIAWRGKAPADCPDGPRYKALGNSWGVNCGEYIFDRIRLVENYDGKSKEGQGDG
jgi:DNA (cytosine-5)-methyltransferase 1